MKILSRFRLFCPAQIRSSKTAVLGRNEVLPQAGIQAILIISSTDISSNVHFILQLPAGVEVTLVCGTAQVGENQYHCPPQ